MDGSVTFCIYPSTPLRQEYGLSLPPGAVLW
jgi:hypothetical protein